MMQIGLRGVWVLISHVVHPEGTAAAPAHLCSTHRLSVVPSSQWEVLQTRRSSFHPTCLLTFLPLSPPHPTCRPVPGSRSEVFQDKELTLVQKRALMRFLKATAEAMEGAGPLQVTLGFCCRWRWGFFSLIRSPLWCRFVPAGDPECGWHVWGASLFPPFACGGGQGVSACGLRGRAWAR